MLVPAQGKLPADLEPGLMGYSTEWIVLIFILATLAGVTYQCYQAGHLALLGGSVAVALALVAVLHRMDRLSESPRSNRK